jgi:hypothetical protein
MQLTLGTLSHKRPRQGTLFFQRPDVQQAVERVHRRHPSALLRIVPTGCRLPLDEADGMTFTPYRSVS